MDKTVIRRINGYLTGAKSWSATRLTEIETRESLPINTKADADFVRARHHAEIISAARKLKDEMTQEIDRDVIKQMILNDPGSKECKHFQKQKHIQEIKDAAKEYEL